MVFSRTLFRAAITPSSTSQRPNGRMRFRKRRTTSLDSFTCSGTPTIAPWEPRTKDDELFNSASKVSGALSAATISLKSKVSVVYQFKFHYFAVGGDCWQKYALVEAGNVDELQTPKELVYTIEDEYVRKQIYLSSLNA